MSTRRLSRGKKCILLSEGSCIGENCSAYFAPAQYMVSPSLTIEGQELRHKFFELETAQDIADLLEIDLKILRYHIYITSYDKRYTKFEIPKRSGGVRTICAPISALKIIQKKLSQVLIQVYIPKAYVHSSSWIKVYFLILKHMSIEEVCLI